MGHGKKIRLLIVDYSETIRNILKEIINTDPLIEVVTTANDGQDAIKNVAALSPDAIIMYLNMPLMDGFEPIKKIMEDTPVPIVTVNSNTEL